MLQQSSKVQLPESSTVSNHISLAGSPKPPISRQKSACALHRTQWRAKQKQGGNLGWIWFKLGIYGAPARTGCSSRLGTVRHRIALPYGTPLQYSTLSVLCIICVRGMDDESWTLSLVQSIISVRGRCKPLLTTLVLAAMHCADRSSPKWPRPSLFHCVPSPTNTPYSILPRSITKYFPAPSFPPEGVMSGVNE
jgi:hypothetical protein